MFLSKGRLNWKFTYSGNLRRIAEDLNQQPSDYKSEFTDSGNLQSITDAWKVQVLTGIEIWQPENLWIGGINKRLKKEGLVCYVIRNPVAEVRMRLRLPMHFQIYPISDQYSVHDTSTPYSIAFGQSALLLDTLAHFLKSKGHEIWVT